MQMSAKQQNTGQDRDKNSYFDK